MNDEEDSLINYIRRSSLLDHPSPPYMMYEVADAIRQNRVLINLPFSPFPSLPWAITGLTSSAGVTQMLRASGRGSLTPLDSRGRP